jgi:NAD(P)H-hydrate epimerase
MPKVLIVSGAGNNGGDGAVVARHLDAWGFAVQVFWLAKPEQLHNDAKTQWLILERSGINQSTWFDSGNDNAYLAELDFLIAGVDWIVDALLGTGLTRPVEGTLRAVIETINRSNKPVLALDIPSGLDTDTGMPLGTAIRAHATATFVAPKLGFAAAGATAFTGLVGVIDIGLPRKLLMPFFA